MARCRIGFNPDVAAGLPRDVVCKRAPNCPFWTDEDIQIYALAAIRAADEWEAQQRAAAGPQPARERDTDAWWAD